MSFKTTFWLSLLVALGVHGMVLGGFILLEFWEPPTTPPELIMIRGDSDREGLPIEVVAIAPGTIRKGDKNTPGGDGAPRVVATPPPVPVKPLPEPPSPRVDKPVPDPVQKADPPSPFLPPKEQGKPRVQPVPMEPAGETRPVTEAPPATGNPGLVGAPGGSRFPIGTPSAGGTVGSRSGARMAEGAAPPLYPLEAREEGVEGTPVIWLRISAEGQVLEAKIHKSCGHAILDHAALRWARVQKFLPAIRDNKPIEAEVTKPVRFYLY